MLIEILCIGTEILKGATINTNASYISKKLISHGYETSFQSVYDDSKNKIELGINTALNRADVIIVTGGLGPTIDDNTKKAVSDLFKIPLKFSKKIAENIEKRFGKIESLEDQSTILDCRYVFLNEIGTAPGFAVNYEGKTVILLPGVPIEMKDMFDKHVIAFLKKHYPIKNKLIQERVDIALITENKVDIFLRSIEDKAISFGIYPHPGYVNLTISSKESSLKINEIKKKIESEFSNFIFKSENGEIQEAVHDLFLQNNKKIVFAESCSGGYLSSLITGISGASKYFLGSFVTYSNQLKKDILDVKDDTLNKYGAVSLEVVEEMVKGAIKKTDADYAIAISGIAGPTGATIDKPIGTVAIAILKKNEDVNSGIFHFNGNREFIIQIASNFALGMLYIKEKYKINYFKL